MHILFRKVVCRRWCHVALSSVWSFCSQWMPPMGWVLWNNLCALWAHHINIKHKRTACTVHWARGKWKNTWINIFSFIIAQRGRAYKYIRFSFYAIFPVRNSIFLLLSTACVDTLHTALIHCCGPHSILGPCAQQHRTPAFVTMEIKEIALISPSFSIPSSKLSLRRDGTDCRRENRIFLIVSCALSSFFVIIFCNHQ